MQSSLTVGIIIFTGFLFGEIASRVRLPRVTGYLLAGVFLNPSFLNLASVDLREHTSLVTDISLAFIAFSVGGTLLFRRIKELGREIVYVTLLEAEFAFLIVIIGFSAAASFLINLPDATWFATYLPISLLVGSLASPTDPSATLAVAHQYGAKGEVTSLVMSVAAFDDALGIINYSLAIVVAGALVSHQSMDLQSAVWKAAIVIIGAVALGVAFGFLLNLIVAYVKKETEGSLVVLVLGLLLLCSGIAKLLAVDELLAAMAMGTVVVNFSTKRDRIFKILERYTEELVFVLFFTLSGMYLNFSVLSQGYVLVLLFVVLRTIGKASGTVIGASVAKSSPTVKKYTAGGLIPQGGIVVGLALMTRQNQAFDSVSDVVVSLIIGATVVHEVIGPVLAKISLTKAGEITSQ